jgi:hypothetical protein
VCHENPVNAPLYISRGYGACQEWLVSKWIKAARNKIILVANIDVNIKYRETGEN